MDIVVPFRIRKRELDGIVNDEAKKIFEKVKEGLGLSLNPAGLILDGIRHSARAMNSSRVRAPRLGLPPLNSQLALPLSGKSHSR
jgi:hypothetical protein